MPIDLWKEVFLEANPEPQYVELFVKMLLAGVRQTLEEAARKVRYEAIPDSIIVWRDPIPLVAVASLYVVGEAEGKLKVLPVEPMPELMERVVEAIVLETGAATYPLRYNPGYGKDRVADSLQRAMRVVKGAALRTVDVTDAPAPIAIALHRAGVRTYTIVRRKGYEVLIEKFSL